MPKSGKSIRPPRFGRIRADVRTILADFGRNRPAEPGQTWSTCRPELGRHVAQCCPSLANNRAKTGQARPNLPAYMWSNEMRPQSPNCCRTRANYGKPIEITPSWPKSATKYRDQASFGRRRADVAEGMPNLVEADTIEYKFAQEVNGLRYQRNNSDVEAA